MDKLKTRELTDEETRDRLFGHLEALIDYWENQGESRRDAMEGLVFSILVTLDGESGGLPAWILAPDPHPEDREFHKNRGENWFPENDFLLVSFNLSGTLHEYWSRRKRGQNT